MQVKKGRQIWHNRGSTDLQRQRTIVRRRGTHECGRGRSLLAAVMAIVALAAVLLGGAPAPADADAPENVVLDWNLHAVNALHNAPTAPTPGAGQPPQVAAQHMAMVQGAVYDAVTMLDGGHEPYLADLPPAPTSASKVAAVSTAAHHVLVGVVLVPPLSQVIVDRLNGLYADSLAAATTADGTTAVAAGIAAGEAAAQGMLNARADDGRYGTFTFTVGADAGEWRPTPTVNDPFAWVARVEPFILESTSQFRTNGPRALTSGAYAKEYNEVKVFGGPDTADSPRTEAQTAVARFYTVNPLELYNRAFRGISEAEELTLVEEARLFAMLNMAGADALINCWDDKAFWNFWRPITAIQQGENDGNPRTAGDSGWSSFSPSPPYPDHSSGYNCYTGAFMHTARAFFGDDAMEFSLVRIAPNVANVTRDYARFTDVIDDTIDARVYQGIHFRSSDVQGARIGKNVARWLDKHFFQPVN